MPDTSRFRVLYLSHLSQPALNRPIYQAIRRRKVRRIVELGIGTCQRALRMIEVARLNAPVRQIYYTGTDLFEDRSPADGSGVTLKTAHRLLKSSGARIQLVPGDPLTALARTANNLADTDLVILSHGQAQTSPDRVWFYLPRVLHASSLVLIERMNADGEVRLHEATPVEIENLAAGASGRRAA